MPDHPSSTALQVVVGRRLELTGTLLSQLLKSKESVMEVPDCSVLQQAADAAATAATALATATAADGLVAAQQLINSSIPDSSKSERSSSRNSDVTIEQVS